MPPSADTIQNYKHLLQATGTRVRHSIVKGKEKIVAHAAKRTQKKTQNILRKLGKMT